MARNEEKQQGRLNRLWLQRQREEGRLRDVHEQRPKLSSLTSASAVKRWIPSIKEDIEYYLQQSQLSHYPERKIAQFQLRIEALEKLYKSFIVKLRVLDPSCKHQPWTPRAYCRRRADTQDFPGSSQCVKVKNPRPAESHGGSSQWSGPERDLARETGCLQTSASEGQGPRSHSESRFHTLVPTNPSEAACADQDRPLSFDRTRLAVAAATFRGPSSLSLGTPSLARVLQSGLPNLVKASFTSSTQSRHTETDGGAWMGSVVGQRRAVQEGKSDCEAAERKPGRSSSPGTPHVLGLDSYYSSSDDDCNT